MPRPSQADPDRSTKTAILPDRVELAYRGLVSGWRKSRIKKALKDAYGLGFRSAEEIIFQARKRRAAELNHVSGLGRFPVS